MIVVDKNKVKIECHNEPIAHVLAEATLGVKAVYDAVKKEFGDENMLKELILENIQEALNYNKMEDNLS